MLEKRGSGFNVAPAILTKFYRVLRGHVILEAEIIAYIATGDLIFD